MQYIDISTYCFITSQNTLSTVSHAYGSRFACSLCRGGWVKLDDPVHAREVHTPCHHISGHQYATV